MYKREFNEESEMQVPKNYSGTAIQQDSSPADSESENYQETTAPVSNYECQDSEKCSTNSNFSLGNLFGFFGKGGGPSSIKFDKEDILIIGTAMFLLFSKNRDTETAIMLLLLLFL